MQDDTAFDAGKLLALCVLRAKTASVHIFSWT